MAKHHYTLLQEDILFEVKVFAYSHRLSYKILSRSGYPWSVVYEIGGETYYLPEAPQYADGSVYSRGQTRRWYRKYLEQYVPIEGELDFSHMVIADG